MERQYWAVAAGDGEREFLDICIRYGVILDGPGAYGTYSAEVYSDVLGDPCADLNRFCNEVKEDDVIALRLGLHKIYAVGIVVGKYEWNDIFADVDGWDLQHTRRVNWLWIAPKENEKYVPKEFPHKDRMTIGTTQKIIKKEILQWIDSLQLDYESAVELPLIPHFSEKDSNSESLESITDYLYAKGMAFSSIENMVSVLDDLKMIANWYKKEQTSVSEFETEAFLIIPLLKALGWTPQKMALEYSANGKKIDLALFNKLPREDENVISILEAKRKNRSCLKAFEQALDYADTKKKCNRIIVSDGIRYGVFLKNKDDKFYLHAFMNITNPRKDYFIYGCKGIQEALWTMSPDWSDIV